MDNESLFTDERSGLSNLAGSSKLGKYAWLWDSGPKKIGLALIVGILLLVGLYYKFKPSATVTHPPGHTGQQVSHQQSRPTSGMVEINREWSKEVINLDQAMDVAYRMISPDNAYWQVRLNHDDTRVYTLFPNNAPGNRTLRTKRSDVFQWRIATNQNVANGTVAWNLVPRTP